MALSPTTESIIIALAIAFSTTIAINLYQRSQKVYKFPPGPTPKPILGNIFDLPTENVAREFATWSQKFNSDILYATALGDNIVILNKKEDADELLEKRAAIYSDRPIFPIIKLLGWQFNMAFYQHDDDWRLHRKISQNFFRPANLLATIHPVITEKVHKLLAGFLASPEDFILHNKMLSIAIPMKTMYGYDIETIHDPCIEAAEKSTHMGVNLLLPGNSMINIIPALAYIPAWVPGASSHKLAAKVKDLVTQMDTMTTDFVMKRLSEGTAVPSLVSSFYERKVTHGATNVDERATRNVAMTTYIAAGDTTMSSTLTLIYLLAAYPEIQKKAQAEIDRIVGSTRLPNFDDRKSMPYIEALYRELMRWMPPTQLGIPRRAGDNDYYKGYYIPKGTIVYSNIRAMTRDPSIYEDPDTFNPDRFFDKYGNLNSDSQVLTYGFGRRVCVGRHVASATVWLTIASVLASFNIEKAKDNLGQVVGWNDDFEDSGLLIQKVPFMCNITPRSEGWKSLIEAVSDE